MATRYGSMAALGDEAAPAAARGRLTRVATLSAIVALGVCALLLAPTTTQLRAYSPSAAVDTAAAPALSTWAQRAQIEEGLMADAQRNAAAAAPDSRPPPQEQTARGPRTAPAPRRATEAGEPEAGPVAAGEPMSLVRPDPEITNSPDPEDYSHMVCAHESPAFEQAHFTAVNDAYPPRVLYEACYKSYLCCTGYTTWCLASENYRAKCETCMSAYAPASLTKEAASHLKHGFITVEDVEQSRLDTLHGFAEEPAEGEGKHLWRMPTMTEKAVFGATCWQAVDWCNSQCPRDGKTFMHGQCGDCVAHFDEFKERFDMPDAMHRTDQTNVGLVQLEAH